MKSLKQNYGVYVIDIRKFFVAYHARNSKVVAPINLITYNFV
jgi:hypothetical protein